MNAMAWDEVVATLEGQALAGAPGLLPVVEVAEFLAASRYARSLLPTADGDTLVLRRPGAGDELRIRFDAGARRFTLLHRHRADDARPWLRECEAGEWQAVLERTFHKRLHWFHEG